MAFCVANLLNKSHIIKLFACSESGAFGAPAGPGPEDGQVGDSHPCPFTGHTQPLHVIELHPLQTNMSQP